MAAARPEDGVFFPGRGTLAGVGATAPARRLRQWVESFKKGVEVARGGLGSRRWPQADHLLGMETDLPHNDLEEDQGEWLWCWLAVDWPEDEPDPYHVYVA
jgi:hypothetical protein